MNAVEKKKQLGQYFTTNYNYIFSKFNFIEKIDNAIEIIEPFAGKCDLFKFLQENYSISSNDWTLKAFDIDITNNKTDFVIEENDSLENPPKYTDNFVLTNPPYLSLNKSKDKLNIVYKKYNQDDLYKCFIESLIDLKPTGGAIIIPANFLSSVRKKDIGLRLRFFKMFQIDIINIFEEQVFNDTKYFVCAIQFFKNKEFIDDSKNTHINIFKNKKLYKDFIFDMNKLNKKNNAMIGGQIYDTDIFTLDTNIYINRLTKKNKNDFKSTRIYVKCLDDNEDKQISMKYLEEDEDLYIDETDNLSARSFMTLIIYKNENNTIISLDETNQKILINEFNKLMKEYRQKYNSLFLTNFRESSDIARKRISFSLVYNLCNYIIQNNNLL